MTKIVNILLISASLAFIILGALNFEEIKESFTHEKEQNVREKADFVEASQLLQLDRPLESLIIVKKYTDKIDSTSSRGRAWLELLVRGSEALPDTQQLLYVFEYSPEALKGHEKGALRVANAFLAENNYQDYEILRKFFKKEETNSPQWTLLDADSLIAQGKNAAAIALLQTRYFEREEETSRLLRLALLHINQHPKFAWDYLSQAAKKDPSNPDIALFRARFLESSGKEEIAEAEWSRVAAQTNAPGWIKEESVDYNLRHHQYKQALKLLEGNLSPSTNSSLVLKALFLSKIIAPVPFNFKTKDPSVYSYIATLPEAKFWDESTFAASLEKSPSVNEEQATYWLRLLQNIKEGREEDALTLLDHPTFKGQPWDQDLANSLKSILHYRLHGSFFSATPEEPSSYPEFFKELNTYANGVTPSAGIEDLLKGKEAFSALFLSRGWNEAAIKLHTMHSLPNDTPEWVAPQFTKVLRENRGIKEALQFANLQRQTAALRLIRAKLLIENKQFDDGEAELESLAMLQTPQSIIAAELLSQRLFAKGAWSRTKEALNLQEKFKNSPRGQEILARIALEEHEEEEAARLYAGIEENSTEAKSFLAKRAFSQGDYRRAYLLTEELLKIDPTNATLKENLNLLLKSQDS